MTIAATLLTLTLGASPWSAALSAAAQDLATLPPEVRATQIYLAAPAGDVDAGAIALALNLAVSHSRVLQSPVVLHGGRLIRYDLATLCPQADDLANALAQHVALALQDPYFRVRVVEGKHVRAVLAPHLGEEVSAAWTEVASGALAPFRADWWLTRVLSTTDGGLYYRLRGIDDDTTQAKYLASRGASEAQVAALRSDERAGILRSGVTGKPRRVDVFRGAGVRASAGTGLVAITHDLFDADTQAERDPIRNLLNFQDRAREAILELPNGLHEFSLWNSDGRLVDEAPPNVASDHMVPAPNTPRLEPAIGCVRCHGPDGGWKPFANDAKTILAASSAAGDVSQVDQLDTLDRLAGLYSGDLSVPLRLGRDSYADAVFRLTGRNVEDVSAAIAGVFARYRYDAVTPAVAVSELTAQPVPDRPEAALFGMLGTATPEDPILVALMAGLSVTRDRWELVFGDAVSRVQVNSQAEAVLR